MTRPVRLDRVVLLHDFSRALGGASHLVRVLVDQLRARGIPVTFITGDHGAGWDRGDVELVPLRGSPLLDRPRLQAAALGIYNRAAARAVRDWIARHDTPGTVYHLHGWSKILTPAVFGPLRAVGRRLVLHAHDYFNCCPNGAFFDYPAGRDCALVPLSSDCLHCACDRSSQAEKFWRAGREMLRRRLFGGMAGAGRMLLIHPGQAPRFVAGGWPADKLHPVRNPVTPPCAGRVMAEANRGVLFIGRLSPEKGADLAARAALAAGLPLTLVGDGPEADRVRRIYPAARLLGCQDRAGVARALSQARVAVMPSRWSEPFGLVALEAIGSGVPVVLDERALIAPEVERAGLGIATDTADSDAFAAALAHLHDDGARVAAMSRAGHAHFRELCNSDHGWTERVVRHYRAVLAAARKAAPA